MGKKKDWTPEKIKYELDKIGFNYTKVDIRHGLSKNAAHKAARLPHKSGEQAIAEVLGLSPQEIWPSRFHLDGSRLERFSYDYKPKKEKRNINKALKNKHCAEVRYAS